MTKLLLIEDDLELSEVLSSYLTQFGMKVVSAEDPFLGLSFLTQEKFDLVILDLTLPGIDGLEVILKIRQLSSIPIIISSARDDITDKIIGMERGADDYMPKPYDPRELVSRIKTILRRVQTKTEPNEALKQTLFVLDEKARAIYFKGVVLELTGAEYDILWLLMKYKNSAVSREQLLYESEHIDDDSSIKNVDVMISRIRQKLAKIDAYNSYIKPVRGVGYMLSCRI